MTSKYVTIPSPTMGLNKNGPVADQPLLTSRDIVNCRPFDKSGRMRLAARNGMSAYFTGALVTAGLKVQALSGITYNARHVTYSADSIPDEIWATATRGATVNRIIAGSSDDFFFVQNNAALVRVNRYGVVMSSVNLPFSTVAPGYSSAHTWEVVGTDDQGAVFVASTESGGGTDQNTGLLKYVEGLADRNVMEIQWAVQPLAGTSTPGAFVVRAIGFQGRIYVCCNRTANDTMLLAEYVDTDDTTPPDCILRLSWKDGNVTTDLGATTPTVTTAPSTLWGANHVYAHDMDLRRDGGPLEIVVTGGIIPGAGTGARFLFKIPVATYLVSANYWIETAAATALSSSPVIVCGGIGYACRFSFGGSVYSMGPRNTNDNAWFRHIYDTGTAFQVVPGAGNPAWFRTAAQDLGGAANEPLYAHPFFQVDPFFNAFVPTTRSDAVYAAKVFLYGVTSSVYASILYQVGSPAAAAADQTAKSVALASTMPDYQTDDTKVAEIVFTAGTAVTTLTGTSASIHGYRVLAALPVAISPRAVRNVGVSGGTIKVFTTGGTASPTNNTARSTPLSADARFVSVCECQGRLYFSDGVDYCVYDPRATVASPNGIISNLVATSLGVIRPRGRFVAFWNNRLILARFPDDPYNWQMFAFGDPGNVDESPSLDPIATQAISGNAASAGITPDIINCLFSYSDDYLIFGGDHSIRILAGDPMVLGRFGLLSDKVGIAFGSPICTDPEGRIYFFGSRGGVYSIHPQTRELFWLTRDTIEADLSDVDLASNYVRMEWNTRDNGLHLFVMPYGVGGTQLTHYFWSAKTKGWFPDLFGTSNDTHVQPTACCVIDGDLPGDRVMLIGTEDGRVLKWDTTANLDDDMSIDSKALIGPFAPKESALETRFMDPEIVLAKAGGGTYVRFFVSEDDSLPSQSIARMKLAPGRNNVSMRACGSYIYVEFRSATQTTDSYGLGQWAVESLGLKVAPAGRKARA